MSRLNWDREQRLGRLAASLGTPDGEGTRADPAVAQVGRRPRRPSPPRILRLTRAQSASLTVKQVTLLTELANDVVSAFDAQRRGQSKKATRRATAARLRARSVAISLRRSHHAERMVVANKALSLVASLGRKGIRTEGAQNNICHRCHLALTPSDHAAGRSEHPECD
jgi:hypothetical protein